MYMNNELQKISNWFRSNKMAINTAKIKFIVFRTRGKRIDPEDCILIFNNSEIENLTAPAFYFPSPECTMTVLKKFLNCWVSSLMSNCHLMITYPTYVEKFRNLCTA
jgi:hypothetical protein